MTDPYAFLRNADAVAFFDEGATHGDPALLTRHYDAELACGTVGRMIEDARAALADVPESAVRAILKVGDLLIAELVRSGKVVIKGGPQVWDKNVAARMSRVDLMPAVLWLLAEHKLVLGSEGIPDVHVTPARFCAAFVLRATFSSIDFGYTNGIDDLPVCYLVEASQVYGYMTILKQQEAPGIGEVVYRQVTRRSLQRAQNARHEENRQLEREVREWWNAHKSEPGMTKDKAADMLAGKVVPLSWRTVRDHLKGV